MSDAFEKSVSQDSRSLTRAALADTQCAGAGVGGQSYASGGAGAGEDDGGTAEPGSQPVDSAGGLFLASGDHLHGGLECVGCVRCDTEWRAGCEQSVPRVVSMVSSGFDGVVGSGIVSSCS